VYSLIFGCPQAHEDDAERASGAGAGGAATKLDAGSDTALQMRVGIATGLVVVGDLIADDPAHECEVVAGDEGKGLQSGPPKDR